MVGKMTLRGFGSVVLALPFILSGVLKLQDPTRFLLDLQNFAFIPYPIAYATSLWLPWFELICAFCCFSKHLRGPALCMLVGLCLVFVAFILVATGLGYDADCGCFGEWLVFPNTASHVLFNGLLAVGLAALYRMDDKV